MEANVDDSKFVYEVNDPNYFQLNKKQSMKHVPLVSDREANKGDVHGHDHSESGDDEEFTKIKNKMTVGADKSKMMKNLTQ